MQNTENKNIWEDFYTANKTKSNTPKWISNLARTSGTRNITIDVWNELADQVRQIASDSDNVLHFVQGLETAFSNGTISELMSIVHKGEPLTIQRWFDSHLELFPSIKNVHYVPEDIPEHIELTGASFKGAFTHDEVAEYPGYMSDILSDGDVNTIAYNPKYDATYTDEHQCVVTFNEKFVSKVLVYCNRITDLSNFDTVSKYTVSYGKNYYGDPGAWIESWGTLSGISNPQIIDIHKEINFIKLSTLLNEESSEKLPIYEIDVLGYNATGYYVFELTNGETFRISTGNLNSIIDKVSIIEASCKGYAQQAEEWATTIKNLKGKVGGYPELEHIEGEIYPKIPSHYLNQIDIKQYVKVKDESELDTVIAQLYDIAIIVGEELEYNEEGAVIGTKEAIESSWLLFDVKEDGTREWIKFGLSYATNAGFATYANNAGRANDARKINGLTVTKISEEDFNNLSDAEKENGIYFVVLGTVEGDSND